MNCGTIYLPVSLSVIGWCGTSTGWLADEWGRFSKLAPALISAPRFFALGRYKQVNLKNAND